MKKLLSFLVIAIIGINSVKAQTLSGEVVAGLNIADVSELDSRIGFHVGVVGSYGFSNEFNGAYANAGALISLKGGQLDYGSILKANLDAYYLEIPIHIGYKHSLSENFAIFGEFGPYIGIGLFGKSKIESEGESISVDTFSEDGGVKRFDMGLGFKLGVEINKLIPISVGYDFGLANINNDNNGGSIKNSNLTISIGYKF